MNQYGFSKSFYDWCLNNNRQYLINRWDYELNNISPFDVLCKSNKKYWFKCQNGIHESQKRTISFLIKNLKCELKCSKCNSFGNYIIKNF